MLAHLDCYERVKIPAGLDNTSKGSYSKAMTNTAYWPLSALPIYQPENILGEPMSKAYASSEVAWEVAEAIGADQVTDVLWATCVFDIADEVTAKRVARAEAAFNAWWESLPEID